MKRRFKIIIEVQEGTFIEIWCNSYHIDFDSYIGNYITKEFKPPKPIKHGDNEYKDMWERSLCS